MRIVATNWIYARSDVKEDYCDRLNICRSKDCPDNPVPCFDANHMADCDSNADCDFNICSFHGHGLLPHRTDAEEISRAMFDKFAMEYYKGKHKDAGKAVSLFFCFEFARWFVWPV